MDSGKQQGFFFFEPRYFFLTTSKDIKTAQELLEKIIDRSVKWLDERKRNGELAPTRDEMLQLSPLGIYLRATNDKYKMLHGKDALTDHLIHEMMERTMDGTYVLDAVEIKTKKTDYTRVRPRHILPDGRLGTPWIWREVDTKKVVMTYEVMYQERNNRRRPGDRRAPRKKKKEENVTAETKKPKRKKDKDDSEEVPEKKPSKRRKKAIDDGPAIAAEEKEKKKKKPKKATTKDAPKKSSGAAATALLFASPSPGIARAESEGDDDDDCGSARNPAPSLKVSVFQKKLASYFANKCQDEIGVNGIRTMTGEKIVHTHEMKKIKQFNF